MPCRKGFSRRVAMRKALVVGVDYYDHLSNLQGCVRDAQAVERVLERNGDGTLNFTVRCLLATDSKRSVSRELLRDSIRALFSSEDDTALFYFAGHGYLD